MGQSNGQPIVVGWRERIDLPEWGIHGLRVKIDTGARTSAIHVSDFAALEDGRLRFDVVKRINPTHKHVTVEADHVRVSSVKPSSGEAQERPVVRALIRLGPIEREIEIGLVNRDGMLCRMLLGRTALEGLLVDASRKYVVSKRRGKRKAEGG